MTQKLYCYICDVCRVVIGDGEAPHPRPQLCPGCFAKDFLEEHKELMEDVQKIEEWEKEYNGS